MVVNDALHIVPCFVDFVVNRRFAGFIALAALIRFAALVGIGEHGDTIAFLDAIEHRPIFPLATSFGAIEIDLELVIDDAHILAQTLRLEVLERDGRKIEDVLGFLGA